MFLIVLGFHFFPNNSFEFGKRKKTGKKKIKEKFDYNRILMYVQNSQQNQNLFQIALL
jgi:hypothetical protein